MSKRTVTRLLIALVIVAAGLGLYYVAAPKPSITQSPHSLLNALPSDAPLAVKVQRKNDLEAAAQNAEYLEIKDCKPDPLIMKTVNKQKLMIKNSGAQRRVLQFNGKSYTVPAHDAVSIDLDFAKGELHPWYWYTCDMDKHTSGIVWVVFTYFLKPTFL